MFAGTSEDILGLTLEAASLGDLVDAAMDIVPELLAANADVLPAGCVIDIRLTQPPGDDRSTPMPGMRPSPAS